jgi:hypothetical protein
MEADSEFEEGDSSSDYLNEVKRGASQQYDAALLFSLAYGS